MKRGVNLSHWFSQTPLSSHPPGKATKKDMKRIASLGLDHVRLPVDPAWLWRFPGEGPLDADMLKRVDAAIDLALGQGLDVVVDMHPSQKFKAYLESNSLVFGSYERFLGEMARHLAKKYDPKRVAFELLNEPQVDAPARWQAMMERLHAAARKAAPKLTLVLCGGEWSSVDTLCRLVPVDDPRVVYDFHFYDPHIFTHQGAQWGEEAWKGLRKVPYPADPARCAAILKGISNEKQAAAFRQYMEEDWNAERIATRIGRAAAWAKEHQTRIWCGEFGVFGEHAEPADRMRYLSDVRNALEKQGIGWAMWDYSGGFALTRKSWRGRQVDPAVAKALGLRPE